jgi:hypothetical protein
MSARLQQALVRCAARVPWYKLDTYKAGATAVRVKRSGSTVAAVIDPGRRFDRLLGATWTTQQAKGRPFGEEKEEGQ